MGLSIYVYILKFTVISIWTDHPYRSPPYYGRNRYDAPTRTVRVCLVGACSTCPRSTMTIRFMVANLLVSFGSQDPCVWIGEVFFGLLDSYNQLFANFFHLTDTPYLCLLAYFLGFYGRSWILTHSDIICQMMYRRL